MGKEFLAFGNTQILKQTYRHITPIFLKDIDIEEVLASNKISFGSKSLSTLLVTCIMMIKLGHYI